MALVDDVVAELKTGLEDSLSALRKQLGNLRTGRASIALLDPIRVDSYGSAVPLNQVAQLSTPEARLITIKPWDRSQLAAIEKAILNSDLGIMPQNDGEIIRLPIPALTEERRHALVKQAQKRCEEAKIAIRNQRREANELLKAAEKDKDISQDDLKRALANVQVEIDRIVVKLDEVTEQKANEIIEV